MNTTFSWTLGELPKTGTVVWVQPDNQRVVWSHMLEVATRSDVEKELALRYGFRPEPTQCQAAIIKNDKKTDRWQFTIQPV